MSAAQEQEKSLAAQQANSLDEAKKQAEVSAQQQIDVLAEKLQEAQKEVEHVKAEALQSSDDASQVLQKKISQLLEQITKEEGAKAGLQHKLTALQKTLMQRTRSKPSCKIPSSSR